MRNDMTNDRAVAVIVATINEEPIIATGIAEMLEGTLVARLPLPRNGLIINALVTDEPIQIIRNSLSYIVPPQEVGRSISKFSAGCKIHDLKKPNEKEASSPPGSYWRQGGSIMSLIASKTDRKFIVFRPSQALSKLKVASGTIQFEGHISASGYSGTAFLFSENCKPFPYPVTGQIENGQERVILSGEAPLLNKKCQQTGKRSITLTFDYMKTPP
jgi:hypothetical protein